MGNVGHNPFLPLFPSSHLKPSRLDLKTDPCAQCLVLTTEAALEVHRTTQNHCRGRNESVAGSVFILDSPKHEQLG